jgi:hypothetical protein
MSPETSRKLQAFVILAMLSVCEGHLARKATLPDPSAQELARFLTQDADLTQWASTGEVRAMMADPLLQEQATIVAEQLDQVMMADPLLQEQAAEVVTHMQAMMTDPRLQGEAERLAKQIEKRMRANGKPRVATREEVMEAIMTNPILHEPASRLVKQVEAIKANKNFQDQVTRIVQLKETLIADAEIQRLARRVAANMGGPTTDSFSLAEVDRSKSGNALLPRSLAARARSALRGRVTARTGPTTMFSEGDIGILPPLNVWDPLGYIESRDMRRYEEMEIKHGRAAMLGFLHVILTEAGLRFPGYLSDGTFGGQPIKFADVPGGAINTVLAIPGSSWAQIICLCGVLEAGVFKQDPDREAGDIAPEWGPWVRYDDPEVKTFKLNAERQNGRAAMLGITGMILHELVGVDALYPTGGWDMSNSVRPLF